MVKGELAADDAYRTLSEEQALEFHKRIIEKHKDIVSRIVAKSCAFTEAEKIALDENRFAIMGAPVNSADFAG